MDIRLYGKNAYVDGVRLPFLGKGRTKTAWRSADGNVLLWLQEADYGKFGRVWDYSMNAVNYVRRRGEGEGWVAHLPEYKAVGGNEFGEWWVAPYYEPLRRVKGDLAWQQWCALVAAERCAEYPRDAREPSVSTYNRLEETAEALRKARPQWGALADAVGQLGWAASNYNDMTYELLFKNMHVNVKGELLLLDVLFTTLRVPTWWPHEGRHRWP